MSIDVLIEFNKAYLHYTLGFVCLSAYKETTITFIYDLTGEWLHITKITRRAMQKRVFEHMRTSKAQITLYPRNLIGAFAVHLHNYWTLQNV